MKSTKRTHEVREDILKNMRELMESEPQKVIKFVPHFYPAVGGRLPTSAIYNPRHDSIEINFDEVNKNIKPLSRSN